MKNVVITGAAGNLGKAVVEKFVAEGFSVIAVVSPGTPPLDVIGPVETIPTDLSDEKSTEELVNKIIVKYKSIDAALLLVGGFAAGNIFATDGAGLKKMYALNFETAYFMARPVFAQMTKQASGGKIVFVGARAALRAKDGKGLLAYALSKSLIFKLSEYLNAEGADKNITTTVIVPSTIDTPANRKSMPNADYSAWVKAEAIADVLAFITSKHADPLRESVVKIYGNA